MSERDDETNGVESRSRAGEIRFLWHDGAFQLECAGRTGALWLRVFEDGVLQAQETVASAEVAYQRGKVLCARLARGRKREYGKGSA
jgi:hypothetical protein